jgi:uncharacterized RDD family membrane protein YckC
MNENTSESPRYAGLLRRLMAIIYDILLLLAVLFIATSVAMVFNHGEAIEPGQSLYPFYIVYMIIVSFFFYGWFWTHGGQTLGMKTWKMKLEHVNGDAITWSLAFIRFISAAVSWAAAGLGFLWSLVQPEKRTWHDIASRCVLIDLRPDK